MDALKDTPYEISEKARDRARDFGSRVAQMRSPGGPLAGGALRRLRAFFKIKQLHHSNAIEGNRLSLGETRLVVEEGLTITGKPLKDQAEATNLSHAIDYLEDLARDVQRPITEADIRQLHTLVLKGIDDENAGRYRTLEVMITGTSFKPVGPESVPGEMRRFSTWLREASVPSADPVARQDAIVVAAAAHAWLVTIHPFADGNGRVSRLLMNLLLMRYTFPIAVITLDDKKRYYEALEATHSAATVVIEAVRADGSFGAEAGPIVVGEGSEPTRAEPRYDVGPLVDLLLECGEESLEEYVAAAKEHRVATEWAAALASKLNNQEAIRLRNEYEVWKSAMDLLKNQFRQTIELLSEATDAVQLFFKDFGTLEFEKYQSLRDRISTKRTWFFRVDFRGAHGQRLTSTERYLFFFGFASPTVRAKHGAEVGLRVAREQPPSSFEYVPCENYGPGFKFAPDTVELAYVPRDQAFVVRKLDRTLEELKADTIVRTFVQQVLERGFGI